ncbi:MAG: hypothetical protein J4N89_08970 [Chloroflexi bacterium]|nr:hypothetical protein [Chloroflexota bacterium]MCI0823987.1 hypothetical protein [Chloroflexota bacterium]MCI0866668.1 hypothetical protein [Chloroflexota bacterium]
MTENRRQILDMLAEGKINVDEAERLLGLVEAPAGGGSGSTEAGETRKSPPRYLRVVVEPGPDTSDGQCRERVNVRIPMAMIRAGVKLAALIPTHAMDKVNEKLQQRGMGVDLSNLKAEGLEQLLEAMAEMEVDVQDGKQHVRVYME